MNKSKLAKTRYFRMRIRPVARRFDATRELPRIDDDWLVEDTSQDGLRLKNSRTGHGILLPYDHIHDFRSDPSEYPREVKRGFLMLLSQVWLQGNRAGIEPLMRPPSSDRSQ
jgi:hypothetical protein